jgi:hypothetical protein
MTQQQIYLSTIPPLVYGRFFSDSVMSYSCDVYLLFLSIHWSIGCAQHGAFSWLLRLGVYGNSILDLLWTLLRFHFIILFLSCQLLFFIFHLYYTTLAINLNSLPHSSTPPTSFLAYFAHSLYCYYFCTTTVERPDLRKNRKNIYYWQTKIHILLSLPLGSRSRASADQGEALSKFNAS